MNPKWLPTTFEGRLGRLLEECGEVVKEIGKAHRFGLHSRHPDGGPTNVQAILSEARDARHAIDQIEAELEELARNDQEPPCPKCGIDIPGAVCKMPSCGRLQRKVA